MSPAALIDAMRDGATRLGPDYAVTWSLLGVSAALELLIMNGNIFPSSSS
jgi:hypothetical protein